MIQKTVDYTFSIKGHTQYLIVDVYGKPINMTGGWWKSKKAAMQMLNSKGYEFCGMYTKNQNYQHWENWQERIQLAK